MGCNIPICGILLWRNRTYRKKSDLCNIWNYFYFSDSDILGIFEEEIDVNVKPRS